MQYLSQALLGLVKLLNDGEKHSGESLAEALSISRNAVWKHIQQLLKFDVAIETSSRGYRLAEPLMLLDLSALQARLENAEAFVLGSIASTNDWIRSLPKPLNGQMQACLAEHQTKGRGRFQRSWQSPFGKNLLLSLRVFVHQDFSTLGGLTLALGLSVIKALESFGVKNAKCKWPNDVYVEGKKISGILVEAYAESHGEIELIFGIGVNLNASFKTSEVNAISLKDLLQKPVDRTQFAAVLIEIIQQDFSLFLEKGFAAFHSNWNQKDALKGADIEILSGEQKQAGEYAGVDPKGHILMRSQDGQVKAYSSGEVQVRFC